MSKYFTVQDGPHKIRLNRATWQTVRELFKQKDALWQRYSGLPDESPIWANFNSERKAISESYRDVIGTPEYKLYLQGEVSACLNELVGVQRDFGTDY